jgi:uncharacterized protein YbaA (DUF1428 family)
MDIGMGLPFPKMAKARRNEVIVFAWIVYRSRKHRDAVNAKVMKDKRMLAMCDPKKLPFEIKRMACGGFKVLVEA